MPTSSLISLLAFFGCRICTFSLSVRSSSYGNSQQAETSMIGMCFCILPKLLSFSRPLIRGFWQQHRREEKSCACVFCPAELFHWLGAYLNNRKMCPEPEANVVCCSPRGRYLKIKVPNFWIILVSTFTSTCFTISFPSLLHSIYLINKRNKTRNRRAQHDGQWPSLTVHELYLHAITFPLNFYSALKNCSQIVEIWH